MLRWLARRLSTLILAFLLALVVWVSAVVSTDPSVEGVYPRMVDLEVIGQDPAYLQMENIPSQVRITLNAPRSVWEQLNANTSSVRAWIDLSGKGRGEHLASVLTLVEIAPARVTKVEPAEVSLLLEPMATRTLPVELRLSGEPALGYRKGGAQVKPAEATVSGPESLVQQVAGVRARLDVSGANNDVSREALLSAVDRLGEVISGVTISPQVIVITQTVTLQGGYRNVVVKLATGGRVASGYWLTNVSVTPPNVTVFSSNPALVNNLPGFVETMLIDLSGLSDDVDIRASLNLPEGVTQVGEESVLVRLSIAALEGSLPISLPVELIGLPPDLQATAAPETVDVLLTGPLPILNNLKPEGLRVSVNLSGLDPGVYQLTPVVDLLPIEAHVAYILPETLEVTIVAAPLPTPTHAPLPGSSLPATPTATPMIQP
jgi:YbbR domain-containing protein